MNRYVVAPLTARTLPEVRVRAGNNKQVLMLPIEGHKETVLVGQDKQAAAADPNGASFGTQLTREQLTNLSDDPQVLQQQLMDMAGPGAIIRVDSFEGGALPNKSQIRSIRISRDQFAAEFHEAGGINVEIITQPGMGPMRINAQYRLLGDSFGGRSPFVPSAGRKTIATLASAAAARSSRTRAPSTSSSATCTAARHRTSTSSLPAGGTARKRWPYKATMTASTATRTSTTR